MKNFLSYIIFISLFFYSCKKNETATVLDNPDERLNKTLTEYQQQLVGAEFGWKGYLLTGTKVSAIFLFDFTDKNRVSMMADYEPTENESSYRLKALQKPTLMFDTYSTLHLLADPNPEVLNGEVASGYSSDFEFAFKSSSADVITLEGVLNKSKLILIRSKSNAENAEAFTAANQISTALTRLLTYFKRASLKGVEYEVNVNSFNQLFEFKYLENNEQKTVSSNYYVSNGAIYFYEPMTIGTVSISSLQDVNYDTGANVINAKTNDGSPIQIKEATSPLKYDSGAAMRWWNWALASTYVSTSDGFYVNGLVDGLDLKSLAGFRRLDYYPLADGEFDYIRIAGATSYGPAIIPNFDSNGIVVFPNSGFVFGVVPPSAITIYNNFINQLTQPQGYYIIQTSTGSNEDITFDMVSVSDAKAWVSWHY